MAVVKWLVEHRKEGCSYRAMDWAAHNGKLVHYYKLCCLRQVRCSIAVHNNTSSDVLQALSYVLAVLLYWCYCSN
jgi:hypothetical protein